MSSALEKKEGILLDPYEQYRIIKDQVEVIDGVKYAMVSPSSIHQTVSIRIASQLDIQLEGKRCRHFAT